ncbi:isochorismatase [Lentzea aerocolonigenes]|uniref:Isochorismatase n=1 Tax=Lentzea aerocolonigenes TaxID=68170 RepID=A0A0F0GY86_LENAE|nr:isochorismatase family protein [Lentzea aerocolonigenes]KJK46962.1 isochorismatase [Lentzea aerocolonigenes]
MTGIPDIAAYRLPTQGDLPERRVSWTMDPSRAVLLVHDMQRFFLRPFASELAEQVTANIAAVLGHCRTAAMPIAYTAQPGSMSTEDRGLLKDFWGPGMRVDPADREIVDVLAPRPADWRLTKWRYSAFHRSDLLERMRSSGRDQLVVCGIYAHIGVLMTTVDAYSHDIQPFLVADAVADFSVERHLMALDYAARCCAVVLSTKELVE